MDFEDVSWAVDVHVYSCWEEDRIQEDLLRGVLPYPSMEASWVPVVPFQQEEVGNQGGPMCVFEILHEYKN